MMQPLIDIKALTFEQTETFVKDLGRPRYRANQLLRWIYAGGALDFTEMTDLPARDRRMLTERSTISGLKTIEHLVSEDGAEKFLFGLPDGRAVETVLIPEASRLTLCLSSQVGCAQACAFCYTGLMGLKRHLLAHEIVDQVIAVQRGLAARRRRLTNFVLMGQGEPLANLPQVLEALRRMTSPRGLGISPRRITLSTSGLIPQMEELARHPLRVNLAVSLNATTQAVRDRIMPLHHVFPLADLLAACHRYPLAPRQRLTFEYVLLHDINDRPDDARRLARLVQKIPCRINLIPFNGFPGSAFRRPDDAVVLAFQRILSDAGLAVFIRKSRGRDILAACGQLADTTADTTTARSA